MSSHAAPPAQPAPVPATPSVDPAALSAALKVLDQLFRARWSFGSNALVGWTPVDGGLAFICAPALTVFREAHAHKRIVLGRRLMGERTFAEVAKVLDIEPERLVFASAAIATHDPDAVDDLITRYSVTKTRHRAAFLLDIAGFSLFSPEEQAAQLSTLDYSLNIAEETSAALGFTTDLARSTTGDGFYVWNRTKGVDADVNLFCVLTLALAHQALQHRRVAQPYLPRIRTCFGRGSHYSFVQHGRSHGASDYIVGDVTIGLARLVDYARPNQILISDIQYGEDAQEDPESVARFIELVSNMLEGLKDIELAGSAIERLSTYLTGARRPDGSYGVRRLEHRDKHGFLHVAYNAKVNIFLAEGEPVYLGLQDSELRARRGTAEDGLGPS